MLSSMLKELIRATIHSTEKAPVTRGASMNAVSRSGTNEIRGIARLDWLPSSLVADYELPPELLAAGVKPGAFRDPLLTSDAGSAIGVGGPIETPALLGQNREYMAAQLHAYADSSRKNDVYGRMRDIARRLTPEEREALARYLQGTL